MDGRFLNFFSTDLSGGTLYALPLDATGDRKPVEAFHNQSKCRGRLLLMAGFWRMCRTSPEK